MIQEKPEITVKINSLPAATTVENGWQHFQIDCDGQMISVTVKPKIWKDLTDAQAKYPRWVAAITGKMGERTENGFVLLEPDIRIFDLIQRPLFVGLEDPLKLTKEQAVAMIRNMPDDLMEYRYGVHLRDADLTPGQKKFFNAVRDEYRYKSDWLTWDLLDDQSILPELTFARASYYKAFGKESWAFYKLAKEIIERYDSPETKDVTPSAWMFLCEVNQCDAKLKRGGFCGQPTIIGKSESYKIALRWYTDLQKLKEDDFCILEQNNSEKAFRVTWLQALENIGAYIASIDIIFKNKEFRNYALARNHAFRTLSKNKYFQVIALKPNGELEQLEQGKGKRVKNCKNSGFK